MSCEIDALVQKTIWGEFPKDRCPVCGWRFAKDSASGCVPGNCALRPAPIQRADAQRNWSTDIAAAFQILDKLKEHKPILNYDPVSSRWFVRFNGGDSSSADTLPLAICQASLALGTNILDSHFMKGVKMGNVQVGLRYLIEYFYRSPGHKSGWKKEIGRGLIVKVNRRTVDVQMIYSGDTPGVNIERISKNRVVGLG